MLNLPYLIIQQSLITMPKSVRSNREAKKQPALTPKEKKTAKRAKKHVGHHSPFLAKNP